jgi:hypothetical protein
MDPGSRAASPHLSGTTGCIPATRLASGSCQNVGPRNDRGRREAGRCAAPAAQCAEMESTPEKSLQVSRNAPQWLTTYAALSPASGLSSRRRLTSRQLGRLDPSVGGSGPHSFVVRARIGRLTMLARPSLPAARVVTIAHTPLVSRRDGRYNHIFPITGSTIFFAHVLDNAASMAVADIDLPVGRRVTGRSTRRLRRLRPGLRQRSKQSPAIACGCIRRAPSRRVPA